MNKKRTWRKAYSKVRAAKKHGELIVPPKCQRCGEERVVQAHHEDYNKPLEVMFLCQECHVVRHKELGFGFKGPGRPPTSCEYDFLLLEKKYDFAIITDSDAAEVRKLAYRFNYQTGRKLRSFRVDDGVLVIRIDGEK